MVIIESSAENEMIHTWVHPKRNDWIAIGGQWIYNGLCWLPIWVGTNQTMSYINFAADHGNNPTSKPYIFMMKDDYNGQWGSYDDDSELFVCKSGNVFNQLKSRMR